MIIYDLMAKKNAHSLYHLGVLKYNRNIIVNIHNSCKLIEANLYYRGASLNLSNVFFKNSFNLYFSSCVSLIRRESVVFIGMHLWQALLFFPLISFNGNVLIHLHGQAHALRNKSLKYFLWKMISSFSNLVVANPAWVGIPFVKQINNLNHINIRPQPPPKSETVVYYSAVGKKPNNILSLEKRFEAKGLSFVLVDKQLNFKILNDLLEKIGFIYFECVDDYYLYSPSGRISDALNYGLKLVLRSEDVLGICIAKRYKVEYILI